MRERVEVLRVVGRDRRLRLLIGNYFCYAASEAATWIAILVYAHQRGGPGEAGLAAVIQLVPSAIVAPFAGFASDRFRRDRVLAAGSAFQALFIGITGITMLIDGPAPVVYLFGAAAAASMTFSPPTIWSLFPWVTSRPDQIATANAAGSLAESAGFMVGPALAFALLGVGPWAVFLAMAGLMVLATIASLFLDIEEVAGEVPIRAKDVGREMADGFRVLAAPGNRSIAAYLVVIFVLYGAVDVAAVLTADEILGRSENVAGLLGTGMGLGAVIGAAISVVLLGRRRLALPMLAGGVVAGLPLVAVATTSSTATAVALFLLCGVGAQFMEVSGKTLIQRTTTDDVAARVFGVIESTTVLAIAAGAAAISVTAAKLGTRSALVAAGLGVLVAVALLARSVLVVDRSIPPPDTRRIDFLLGIPMFEPLANPIIEQLALNMTSGSVDAGTDLITQGETGHEFFVIEAGELEVIRDGVTRKVVRPGDYVGEVALLRRTTRNATVRARTSCRYWTIEGSVFLEAVTGHPQSRGRAEDVVRSRDAY